MTRGRPRRWPVPVVLAVVLTGAGPHLAFTAGLSELARVAVGRPVDQRAAYTIGPVAYTAPPALSTTYSTYEFDVAETGLPRRAR